MRQRFINMIVTCFKLGYIGPAPGTLGSLVALPLVLIFAYLTNGHNYNTILYLQDLELNLSAIRYFFLLASFFTIILTIIATYAIKQYLKGRDWEDPKEVIIDEVIGQITTVMLVSYSIIILRNSIIILNFSYMVQVILLLLIPFISFRMFDIIKPFPISWVQKRIKNAFGIILDDLIAAVFASLLQYVVIFFFIKNIPK